MVHPEGFAPSLLFLENRVLLLHYGHWYRRRDSNPHLVGFKPTTSTGLGYDGMVHQVGIEPTTTCISDKHSTTELLVLNTEQVCSTLVPPMGIDPIFQL